MDDLELAKGTFHQSAVQSYLAAHMMLSTNFLSPVGLYNAHLACECMLKSLTAQFGKQPLNKHDLLILLDELKGLTKDPSIRQQEPKDIFKWLNPYQELGRYGAMARVQFDPDRTDTNNVKAFGVIAYQPSTDIKRIDLVFVTLYRLTKVDYDIIRLIKNTGSIPQWNFPIPVKDVIYTENEQFQR